EPTEPVEEEEELEAEEETVAEEAKDEEEILTSGPFRYKEVLKGTIKYAEIVSYEGSAEFLVINTVNSLPVLSILDNAFSGCGSLRAVKISRTVQYIGENAFLNCINLNYITVLSSPTVGSNAFSTGGVVYLYAYEGSEVEDCEDITNKIYFKKIYNEGDFLYVRAGAARDQKAIIVRYTGTDSSVVIPETLGDLEVSAIEYGAFFDTTLWDLTIPKNVTVTDYLLMNCPNSPQIHGYAGSEAETFAKNNNLIFIEIIDPGKCGADLSYELDAYDGKLTISGTGAMYSWSETDNAPWYENREKIKSVVIESGVTSIGSYAFDSCVNLESIEAETTVKTVGERAFSGCENLETLNLKSTSVSVGIHAFENCYSFSDKYGFITYRGTLYEYFGDDYEVLIPNGATRIAEEAFSGNELRFVSLPLSVTHIGSKAFGDCEYLYYVLMPKTVTNIADDAFADAPIGKVFCEAGSYAESYAKGKSFTTMDYWQGCFEGRTNEDGTGTLLMYYGAYSDVKVPSVIQGIKITGIGDAAFSIYDLSPTTVYQRTGPIYGKLTSISLPNTIETIGYGAFYAQDRLTSITIPSSCKEIGDEAFVLCSGLTSVTIPSGVKTIGKAAFLSCEGLKDKDGFVRIRNVIYGYFGKPDVTIPYGVTEISDGAFCESDITSVSIPGTVTRIGEDAFALSDLTSVVVPNSVTYIGAYAFSTPRLTKIVVPSSVKTIGYLAFGDNTTVYYTSTRANWDKIDKEYFDNTVIFGKALDNTKISSWANVSTGIKLTWVKVADAAGYQVYRGSTKIATVTSGSTVTYTDTAVKSSANKTAYTYYVRAYKKDSSGTVIYSAKSDGKYTRRMQTPSIKSYSNTSTGIKLTWGAQTGATGYAVYRDGVKIKTTTSTSYTDTASAVAKAANRKTFKYTVKSYYKTSSGTYYYSGSSAVKTAYRMQTPAIKSYSNTSTGIKLTWGAQTGATGYVVYRDGVKIKATTATSYTDISDTVAKAANGKAFKYTVKSYYKTSSGTYHYSGSSAVKTAYRVKAPATFTATAGTGSVTLKFSTVPTGMNYQIYRATSKTGTYSLIKTVSAGTASYRNTGLTKGKTYYYKVRAYKTINSVKVYSAYTAVKYATVK
ncbi:MAG: leucine-rich repeat protein, partial [Clostridia bacterium]|nr:leucine-rich repeat protein [Clostridia bacterium]